MNYFFYILLVLSIVGFSNCQKITAPPSRFQMAGVPNARISTTTKKTTKAPSENIDDSDLNAILDDFVREREIEERKNKYKLPTFSPYLNYDHRSTDDFDLADALETNEVEKGPRKNGGFNGFGTGRDRVAHSRFTALGSGRPMNHRTTENFESCQCTCDVPRDSSYGRNNQCGSRECNQRY